MGLLTSAQLDFGKKGKKLHFLFQIISDMCHNYYLAWHKITYILNEKKKRASVRKD